jgi:hypothetical protein
MQSANVRERLEGLGVIVPPVHATPEYLAHFVRSEIEKWTGPIKASGVTWSEQDRFAGLVRETPSIRPVEVAWDTEAGGNSVATPLCSLRQDNRISGTLQDYGPLLASGGWKTLSVERHDRLRSKRRCATVREMKEGPSRSAIRC